MSLDEHYLFSEPFPQRIGNVDQTVAAEEVASGVLVVIHLLAGGNCPANQELLKVARGLPPASVRYLREIGDHKGTPFVVTEPLPENLPVRKWLEQVTGIPMVLPEPGPRPMTASEPDANKFKKQVWKVPAIPPTLDQAKPGEFTQMFRASGAPVPAPQPAPAAPVPPAPSTPPGPGEFTQLMHAQGYGSPVPAAPPAAPTGSFATPPSRQAGEFTQLMQAASMGSGIRPAAPPPVPPAPPSQATEVHPTPEVDEFARMMQDSAPSPVAPPSPSVPSDYEATRLFSAPPPPEVLRAPRRWTLGVLPPPRHQRRASIRPSHPLSQASSPECCSPRWRRPLANLCSPGAPIRSWREHPADLLNFSDHPFLLPSQRHDHTLRRPRHLSPVPAPGLLQPRRPFSRPSPPRRTRTSSTVCLTSRRLRQFRGPRHFPRRPAVRRRLPRSKVPASTR